MLSPLTGLSIAEKRFLPLFLVLASPGLMMIMQTQSFLLAGLL